jgi:hypothetical protein
MGLHPDRPFVLAEAMLAAVVSHYGDQGVPLPGTRLVTTGQVVADCELAAVAVQRLFNHEGDVGGEVVQALRRHQGHQLRGMLAAVTVLRCVPVLDDDAQPPPAGEIQAGARLILADAQHCWDALRAAEDRGDLTGCNGLAWAGWDSYGPEGGYGGGFLTVRAGLE